MSVLKEMPTRPSPNGTPNDLRPPKGDPKDVDTGNGGAGTDKVDPSAGKTEPGKTEPENTAPEKTDPKKSEPVKPTPVKPEPADGEPTPDWMK